jgi:hypothetical protein
MSYSEQPICTKPTIPGYHKNRPCNGICCIAAQPPPAEVDIEHLVACPVRDVHLGATGLHSRRLTVSGAHCDLRAGEPVTQTHVAQAEPSQ